MGAGSVRTGTPVLPVTRSAGTDGSATLPRVYTFDPPVRPCIIYNHTGNGNQIRVKLNSTDETDFGGASSDHAAGHFPVNDETATEAALGHILAISRVSIITTAGGDDLDDVGVIGWEP